MVLTQYSIHVLDCTRRNTPVLVIHVPAIRFNSAPLTSQMTARHIMHISAARSAHLESIRQICSKSMAAPIFSCSAQSPEPTLSQAPVAHPQCHKQRTLFLHCFASAPDSLRPGLNLRFFPSCLHSPSRVIKPSGQPTWVLPFPGLPSSPPHVSLYPRFHGPRPAVGPNPCRLQF